MADKLPAAGRSALERLAGKASLTVPPATTGALDQIVSAGCMVVEAAGKHIVTIRLAIGRVLMVSLLALAAWRTVGAPASGIGRRLATGFTGVAFVFLTRRRWRYLSFLEPFLLSTALILTSPPQGLRFRATSTWADLFLLCLEGALGIFAMRAVKVFALASTAGGLMSSRKWAAAETKLRELQIASERLYGATHPVSVQSINNLALVLYQRGKQEESLELFEVVARETERLFTAEHPRTALVLTNVAGAYLAAGQYTKAEALLRHVLSNCTRKLPLRHRLVQNAANSLAGVYERLGKYEEADALFDQCLKTSQSSNGDAHPDTIRYMTNLGVVRDQLGHVDEGLQLLQRAAFLSKSLNANDPVVSVATNNLAAFYARHRGPVHATRSLRQVYLDRKRRLGASHPDTLLSLHNAGVNDCASGDLRRARILLKGAMDRREKTLGEDHPDTIASVQQLALATVAAGAHAKPTGTPSSGKGFDLLYRVQDAATRILLRRLAISSGQEALEAVQQSEAHLHIFVSLLIQDFSRSLPHVQRAADILFRRKALGLEAGIAQREDLLSGRHPELNDAIRTWTALRMDVARRALALPGGEGAGASRQDLRALEDQLENLERDLTRSAPELLVEQRLRAVNHEMVAGRLPEGSILVEYFRLRVFDFFAGGTSPWGPARYIAIVLPAQAPDRIQVVDLGPADEIDRLVDTFRLTLMDRRSGLELCSKLLGLIWDRGGAGDPDRSVRRLVLAPDGDLNLLPFGALPLSGGGVVADRFDVSYVGTGRDLAQPAAAAADESREAVVIVDPTFQLVDRNGDRPSEMTAFAREMNDHHSRFEPLPWTQVEGRVVAGRLSVDPLQGEAVLETTVKERLRRARVIHIASHGFFLAPSEDPVLPPTDELKDPMRRSGIALAGAQSYIDGAAVPAGAEDGLLTAEDVAAIDLLGTELVVLSACDTGHGHVRSGEGVFGLRRGFFLAGARTVVMSLWKVDDLATALLMDWYYQNLVQGDAAGRRMGRSEALWDAQRRLRSQLSVGSIRQEWLSSERIARIADSHPEMRARLEELRNSHDDTLPFSDPIYWAPFVLYGDASELSPYGER